MPNKYNKRRRKNKTNGASNNDDTQPEFETKTCQLCNQQFSYPVIFKGKYCSMYCHESVKEAKERQCMSHLFVPPSTGRRGNVKQTSGNSNRSANGEHAANGNRSQKSREQQNGDHPVNGNHHANGAHQPKGHKPPKSRRKRHKSPQITA